MFIPPDDSGDGRPMALGKAHLSIEAGMPRAKKFMNPVHEPKQLALDIGNQLESHAMNGSSLTTATA